MLSLLIPFDFFSAFDTVDNSLLLQNLNSSFVISDSFFSWLTSYLSDRFSTVSFNTFSPPLCSSRICHRTFSLYFIYFSSSLPDWIVLLPVNFLLMIPIFSSFFISNNLERLSLFLNFILSWCGFMHLELNLKKFDLIFLSKPKSLPTITIFSDLTIHPFSNIRSLRFLLDSFFSKP